jgi:hypothetical protein
MEAENTHDWAGKAKETYDEVRERAESWDERVKQFAQEKPLAAIFCAVAGGYALARLSSWWR